VNSSSTPSISKSFLYCFTTEFLGSFRILTSASLSRFSSHTMTGRRPTSSGISPYLTMS
jgi:hypothetical protein